VFREPGIASCAYCATLRDSSANFCPHCGLPAGSRALATSDGDRAQVVAAVEPAEFADPAPAATEVDVEAATAVHAPAVEFGTAPAEVPAAPVEVGAAPEEVPTPPAPVEAAPEEAAADVVEIEETTTVASTPTETAAPPPERPAQAADAVT